MEEGKIFEGYDVRIYVDPNHRPYRACFTIGVQTFYVCEREEREEAEWFVRCLKGAFANYAFHLGHSVGKLLRERDLEIRELQKQILQQQIEIEGLKDLKRTKAK